MAKFKRVWAANTSTTTYIIVVAAVLHKGFVTIFNVMMTELRA